jgi:hypothetical protein
MGPEKFYFSWVEKVVLSPKIICVRAVTIGHEPTETGSAKPALFIFLA